MRAASPRPAQGAAWNATALLGLIVELDYYNQYVVQLAQDAGPGSPPSFRPGAQVVAVNVAEPFDEDGQLEADTPVILWPSQGLYFFSRAPEPEAEEPPAATSYWARVVTGGGPDYLVLRVIADGATSFADAGPASVSAANVWELTVDTAATATVPVSAIVRVWEEPDDEDNLRRFFSYALHTVYR